MARGIYEIKLNNRFYPAVSYEDVLDMVDTETAKLLVDTSFTVSEVVKEEHAVKLFMLAKTMYDAERFEANEVEAAVSALARALGYFSNQEEVTDCVLTWAERFDDMTLAEFEEWLIG